MSRIKAYFTLTCSAFTIVLVLISGTNLWLDGVGLLSTRIILSIFGMVAVVCALMYFTDRIPIKNLWLDSLIRFGDILIIVLPGGWLLGWFTEPLDFVFAVIIDIITYAVIYGVNIIKCRTDAESLNRELGIRKAAELRKKENKNGTNY